MLHSITLSKITWSTPDGHTLLSDLDLTFAPSAPASSPAFVSQPLQVKRGWIWRTTWNEAGTESRTSLMVSPFRDEVGAATDRARASCLVRHVMAGQMIGQWLTARFCSCHTGSRCQHRGHGFRLGMLQRQFELLDGADYLLGSPKPDAGF